MSIPRPKLLTRVTVPSGGWAFRCQISISSALDTNVDCTVTAGDYYVAGDGQSDEFIYELQRVLNVALAAAQANTEQIIWIDSNHKVNISCDGSHYTGATQQDVKWQWTVNDGASIGNVLGFDTSADLRTTSNYETVTADYQHAYGWYSDEDGNLRSDSFEDEDSVIAIQSRTPGGHMKTQRIGSQFDNMVELQLVTREKMFSGDVAYTSASIHPYARNVGLECWWQEVRTGVPFRYYRDGNVDSSVASDRGTATGGAATTLTDTGKAWAIEPQRYKGRILQIESGWEANTSTSVLVRWYISSHTATVLTLANNQVYNFAASDAYFIFDQPYRTYWLDLQRMSRFKPFGHDALDRYDLSIPIARHET